MSILVSASSENEITFILFEEEYTYDLPEGVSSSKLILESNDLYNLLAEVKKIGKMTGGRTLWTLCEYF